MKIIVEKNERARIKKVKELIESAGTNIFAISFIKRSNGKLRKMAGRLHVKNPSYASIPKGDSKRQKTINKDHNLITIFDVNAIRYSKRGNMNGRGEYKSVPLDGVTRIKVGGTIYKIVS
jgi:hypothetical protein